MNKQLSILMVMMMIVAPLAAMPFAVGAPSMPIETPMFTGGDGSIGDPYWIVNVSDLQNMSTDLAAHYILINDIDASNTSVPGHWANNVGEGFLPIGDADDFTGSLDGQGFVIDSLYINRGLSYTGLFDNANPGAVIKNVNLVNAYVKGGQYTGGLVGHLTGVSSTGNSFIINCSVEGTVSGTNRVGGLVGYCYYGDIYNSFSMGTVILTGGGSGSGGLIGLSDNAIINNCYSLADVNGNDNVGGFMGQRNGATISDCYSTGQVSGNSDVGGFIGLSSGGTASDCFWDNETSDQELSAGEGPGVIEGKDTTDMMNNFTFKNASWDFTDTWFSVNGSTRPFLRMEHDTTIRNPHQLQLMVMGLTADYTLANDIDLSDIVEPAQMWGTNATQGSGFVPIGNSTDMFTGTLDGGNLDINGLYINRSSESNIGLLGRIVTPSEITNITLTNVNVSGGENTAALVGYSAFGTVKNCHVACEIWGYGNFVGGLMGYNSLGTVDNSSFDGNVTANVNYVGGLIGRSTGPVTYCSSSGLVDGGGWTGGLIGDTLNSGSVENSTSSSIVDGNSNVGGLIGKSGRPVANSSAFGDVSGGAQVGGLVGYNSATIMNCNSTGNATAIGAGDYIGGLVGRNEGGTLTDCHSTGNLSGDWYLGGFIGYNTGTVTNCTSTGTVSGNVAGSRQGGFVGENNGPIMNCSSTGNASGNDVSGFIGINNGPITNSHSTGNVDGIGNANGGFVGWNDNTITNCYSTGDVSGNEDVGGFVGDNVGGTITECYSTGDATGTSGVNSFAAGFIGVNAAGGQIMNCYSIGNATGAGNYNGGFAAGNYNSIITNCYSIGNASGGSNTGGFLGFNSTGTTSDCFWDVEYSGTIPSDGGTPKNTAEMKQQATFDPPWDFATIWGIYEFNTYPFLQATGPTYVPDADLEITIDGTPEPCNVGDALMYTVAITNNGPDIAVNVVVNITLPLEVTWLNDSQSIGPPIGQYLEAAIGNLDSGESGGIFINVSVDTFVTFITASSEIASDTLDPNMSNNIDWANTTLNRVPTAGDDNYNVDEDSGPNTLDVLANDIDPDGDPFTITAITQGTNGTVAIIDAGLNVTYTPDADYVGSDTFNYTIDDGNGGTDIGTVTIDVNNINDAPVITTTDVTTATEDVLYSVDYNATDIDPSDTLTWSLETDAGWLSIHTTTGVLSGTPTNDDVGTFDVSVKVDDGKGGIDWSNFTLTVSNTNDAPVISTTTAPDGTEGQPYSSQVNASDVDGDALTWSLTSNATWLSINATGALTGTPTSAGTFWANVTVNDGNGGTDSVNLTLTIIGIEPTDTDGDGTPDDEDDFPDDPTEDTDTDGDGVGDNADAFPSDPTEDTDTDGDGIGNNADTDDDGDGIPDTEDDNPLTPDDTDADTGGNNTWLYLIIILVVVGIIGAVIMLRPKRPKPVVDESVEEVPEDISAEGIPKETVAEPIESEELA